jgi:AbrB family looped-hinge helix DNA binding protein
MFQKPKRIVTEATLVKDENSALTPHSSRSTGRRFNDKMIDMKSNVVTVSPKFQVVIPLAVRESTGIKPGEKMMVVNLGGVIRLLPIKPPAAYRGIARGMDTSLPVEPDRL